MHVLPGWLADRCESIAATTQSPKEMAASFGLVSLSAACAGRLDAAAAKEWVEGLNLFVIVVAPPGSAKSPVLKAMLSPLETWEKQLRSEAVPHHAEQRQEQKLLEQKQRDCEKSVEDAAMRIDDALEILESFEHRVANLKKLAAEREGTGYHVAELAAAEADLAKHRDETLPALRAEKEAALTRVKEIAVKLFEVRPTLPKVIADDATPEALRRLMSENGGRIAVLSAEGAGTFSHMGGRYSGEANTDIYTQGYSNEALRGDRQGDRRQDGGPAEGLFVPRSWLTIGLATQPEVFTTAMARPEFRDRGVMDRFLLAKPDVRSGYKDHVAGHHAANSEETKRSREVYHERFLALIETLPEQLEQIQFPEDVGLRLAEWMNTVEVRQRVGGPLEGVIGWAAKAKGNCARLVGLLHVADSFDKEGGWRRPISDETVDRAIELMEWYLHELARHTPSIIPRDELLGAVLHVVAKVKSCNPKYLEHGHTITLGNLSKYCGLPDEKANPILRQQVLEVLESRDWLREAVDPNAGGPGRRTRRFVIHPTLRP